MMVALIKDLVLQGDFNPLGDQLANYSVLLFNLFVSVHSSVGKESNSPIADVCCRMIFIF